MMKNETYNLETKFQEFLSKEFPGTEYELDNDIVKAMRVGFSAGALVGVDLFLEFYNNYKEKLKDDTAAPENV
jgi:hypothetical protein